MDCTLYICNKVNIIANFQIDIDEEEEARWSHWSMQRGYSGMPDPEHLHDIRDMPLRSLAPGLHMGLSVVLDVREEEYYCSGTESVGFKVCPTAYEKMLSVLTLPKNHNGIN